jgi:hypothetical protein
MILTLVAELLAGETLLADRGPVDASTAAAIDVELWGLWRPESQIDPAAVAEIEIVGSRAPVEEPVA